MKIAIQIFLGIIICAIFIGTTVLANLWQIKGIKLIILYVVLFICLSTIMTVVVYYFQKIKLESERKKDEKKW